MTGPARVESLDIVDVDTFGRLPPCADARFDHRSCDYWEDGERGSKASRPAWWQAAAEPPTPRADEHVGRDEPFARASSDAGEFNPFAPTAVAAALDPLGGDDLFAIPAFNPFAPPPPDADEGDAAGPRKLRLLRRGQKVFGSYAKLGQLGSRPVAYIQFGPLSAYPRASAIRDLYPRLPQSPLPAVITCIATIPDVRDQGVAEALVSDVVEDLAGRGFSAIEAFPDLTLGPDEASAAHPAFWLRCAFELFVDDERFPVMRRELR